MAYQDLVRSHLERCLQDVWDVNRLEQDPDGDYPFRDKTCVGWVRVEPERPALVRVFVHAAYQVKRSAALLAEINTLNGRSRLATVSWSDGVVSVSCASPGESLDRMGLRLALDSVTRVAEDISELIATVFGGHLPARPRE